MQNLLNYLINEEQLTAHDRASLKDVEFGLPKDRKYPLHDKEHVQSAIHLFHKCTEFDRKELAFHITIMAKKYGITISKDSLITKYVKAKK